MAAVLPASPASPAGPAGHRAAPAPRRGVPAATHPTPAARPRRAVARLTARVVGRGTTVLAVVLAAYMLLEVLGYRATYPDGMPAQAAALFDTPAVRMLQGPPAGVTTAGGYAAWDDGWVVAAAVAVWSMLVTSRLLRGEEDDDRVAGLLAGPQTARTLTVVRLAVVAGCCAVLAAAVAAGLAAPGEDVAGSVLFGVTVGGFAAVWSGVAAVCAQVLEPRRRALVAAVVVFGVAYALRVVANSTTGRAPLRRVTPWGWLDEVEPFAAQRVWPVVALWTTWAVTAALAVGLRGLRDTGSALLARPDRRDARLRGLHGLAGFGLRTGRGVLLGWAVGLVAWSALLAGLARTMLDVLRGEEGMRTMLEAVGMADMLTVDGYVGVLSVLLGVLLALFVAWRVAAARAEEAEGRLDAVLVRPVSRRRWLWAQVGLAVAGVALLAVVSGLATWAGARVGGAALGAGPAVGSAVAQLPVAVLFAGLATLVLGVAPRLTLALPASLVGLGYVLEIVGPPLDWPAVVLDASPFHHLAAVPLETFAVAPAVTLCALGLLAAVAGVELFHRRDVTGG